MPGSRESIDGLPSSRSRQRADATADNGPDPKRRKVRKGTHSCWACKRRKARCTFSVLSSLGENVPEIDLEDAVCDGCRRRGTPCVSQDVPESVAQEAGNNHSRQVDDRLDRMEALLELLVKNMVRRQALQSEEISVSRETERPGTSHTDMDTAEDDDDDVQRVLPPTTVHSNTPREQNQRRPQKLPEHLSLRQTDLLTPVPSNDGELTTYTSWFGHQRGVDDEVSSIGQPVAIPETPDTNGAQTAQRPANEPAGNASPATATASPTDTPPSGDGANSALHAEYMRKYKALIAAWPSKEDLDIIIGALSAPSRNGLHKVLVYEPFSAVLAAETPPLGNSDVQSILVLPPPGTHLVLVAKKLLMVASFLQHLHPVYDPDLSRLSVPHRELMHRAVEAANSYVTSKDCLVGSLEGVQCLIIEGIFQSNLGNLRRAWLSFRRALSMGQLMGFQHSSAAATVKCLEPGTREYISHECLWFRIVYADRFLSLLLGLPQAIPGDRAVAGAGKRRVAKIGSYPTTRSAAFSISEARQQLQTFEQEHAVVVGHILERNEAWREEEDEERESGTSNEDYRLSTRAIDQELQRASRSMPSAWWQTPTPDEWRGSDGAALFLQTQRVVDQLFHYHLLTQLHLPYMLRRSTQEKSSSSSSSPNFDEDDVLYSKTTCVSASREVLTRFLLLRSVKTVTFFCRNIDFFALLASMTLCLAHLDSHRHGQRGLAAHGFLAHQRLTDLGMVERVLECMDEVATINPGDGLSTKSGSFLRRMLAIEDAAAAAAAAVNGYSADQDIPESTQSRAEQDLRVLVPFLGTIRISREGIVKVSEDSGTSRETITDQAHRSCGLPPTQTGSQPIPQLSPTPAASMGAGSGNGPVVLPYPIAPLQTAPANEISSLCNTPSWPSGFSPSMPPHGPSRSGNEDLQSNPCLQAEQSEDHTLQGVDLAFFENLLLHGSLDIFSISGTTSLPALDTSRENPGVGDAVNGSSAWPWTDRP